MKNIFISRNNTGKDYNISYRRIKTASKRIIIAFGLLLAIHSLTLLSSCKKLIAIPPPTQSITTQEVFADSTDADAGILGIYTTLSKGSLSDLGFGNGLITYFCGLSADEMANGDNQGYSYTPIYLNNLTSGNPLSAVDPLWKQGYAIVYQANASIAGLQQSNGINSTTKIRLIAEAKFLRALCYFNLVNLYGDVPYETTADYRTNQIAPRTAKATIYHELIADLISCQNSLPKDYSLSDGERIRANQACATALLARIYLYTGDFQDAIAQSSVLINNSGTYSLVGDLNQVFSPNSSESILQWKINPTTPPFNATVEGWNFITINGNPPGTAYLNPRLLAAFESGDKRRTSWVDSSLYDGTTYYFPYKYQLGPAQIAANATPTQYYTILRLAEQYLIHAESEANLNNLGSAISDLNIIRSRAGLSAYSGSTTDKSAVLNAIYQERRIELFAEWGHRWFDLKRTGQIDSVMRIATPQKGGGTVWKTTQQLYPISQIELKNNPNLKQNPGY